MIEEEIIFNKLHDILKNSMSNKRTLTVMECAEHINVDLIHYVWFRVMTLAGAVNDNGYLYINENMPYTIKTLAIEFNRPLEDVKFAIKVLKKLQMLELTEDKFFKVKNWIKYQNIDALEKIRIDRNNRVAKHRAKLKNEKIQKENIDKNCINRIND